MEEAEKYRRHIEGAAERIAEVGAWLDQVEALTEGASTEAPPPASSFEDLGREVARFGLRIVKLARAGVRTESPTLPPPAPAVVSSGVLLGPVLVTGGSYGDLPKVERGGFFEDGRPFVDGEAFGCDHANSECMGGCGDECCCGDFRCRDCGFKWRLLGGQRP